MDRFGRDIGTTRRVDETKRTKRGECPTCGTKTHKVNRLTRKKTALTIEGLVIYGQCLKCNPIEGYTQRPPQPCIPQTVEANLNSGVNPADDNKSIVSALTFDQSMPTTWRANIAAAAAEAAAEAAAARDGRPPGGEEDGAEEELAPGRAAAAAAVAADAGDETAADVGDVMVVEERRVARGELETTAATAAAAAAAAAMVGNRGGGLENSSFEKDGRRPSPHPSRSPPSPPLPQARHHITAAPIDLYEGSKLLGGSEEESDEYNEENDNIDFPAMTSRASRTFMDVPVPSSSMSGVERRRSDYSRFGGGFVGGTGPSFANAPSPNDGLGANGSAIPHRRSVAAVGPGSLSANISIANDPSALNNPNDPPSHRFVSPLLPSHAAPPIAAATRTTKDPQRGPSLSPWLGDAKDHDDDLIRPKSPRPSRQVIKAERNARMLSSKSDRTLDRDAIHPSIDNTGSEISSFSRQRRRRSLDSMSRKSVDSGRRSVGGEASSYRSGADQSHRSISKHQSHPRNITMKSKNSRPPSAGGPSQYNRNNGGEGPLSPPLDTPLANFRRSRGDGSVGGSIAGRSVGASSAVGSTGYIHKSPRNRSSAESVASAGRQRSNLPRHGMDLVLDDLPTHKDDHVAVISREKDDFDDDELSDRRERPTPIPTIIVGRSPTPTHQKDHNKEGEDIDDFPIESDYEEEEEEEDDLDGDIRPYGMDFIDPKALTSTNINTGTFNPNSSAPSLGSQVGGSPSDDIQEVLSQKGGTLHRPNTIAAVDVPETYGDRFSAVQGPARADYRRDARRMGHDINETAHFQPHQPYSYDTGVMDHSRNVAGHRFYNNNNNYHEGEYRPGNNRTENYVDIDGVDSQSRSSEHSRRNRRHGTSPSPAIVEYGMGREMNLGGFDRDSPAVASDSRDLPIVGDSSRLGNRNDDSKMDDAAIIIQQASSANNEEQTAHAISHSSLSDYASMDADDGPGVESGISSSNPANYGRSNGEDGIGSRFNHPGLQSSDGANIIDAGVSAWSQREAEDLQFADNLSGEHEETVFSSDGRSSKGGETIGSNRAPGTTVFAPAPAPVRGTNNERGQTQKLESNDRMQPSNIYQNQDSDPKQFIDELQGRDKRDMSDVPGQGSTSNSSEDPSPGNAPPKTTTQIDAPDGGNEDIMVTPKPRDSDVTRSSRTPLSAGSRQTYQEISSVDIDVASQPEQAVKAMKKAKISEIPFILKCLQLHPTHARLHQSAYDSIFELAVRQDPRVKLSLIMNKAVQIILGGMWGHLNTPSVQAAALRALWGIAASDDASSPNDIMANQEGVIDVILISMQTHLEDCGVQVAGCGVLSCLSSAAAQNSSVDDGTSSSEAIPAVLNAMDMQSTTPIVQEWGMKTLYNQCVRSDGNAVRFADLSSQGFGIDIVYRAMKRFRNELVIQEWGCRLFFCLSSNDKAAAVMTKSAEPIQSVTEAILRFLDDPDATTMHEAACGTFANLSALADRNNIFVRSSSLLKAVCKVMRTYTSSEAVQVEASAALANLAVSVEARVDIIAEGGLQSLLSAAKAFPRNVALQEETLRALFCLCVDSSEAVDFLSSDGAISIVVGAMKFHPESNTAHEMACGLIAKLATMHKNHNSLIAMGAVDAISAALAKCQNDRNLSEVCCCALRNFSDCADSCNVLVNTHAIHAAVQCMRTHCDSEMVQESTCCMFWNIATNSEQVISAIVDTSDIQFIINAMQNLPGSVTVQEVACGTLWSLATLSNVGENMKKAIVKADGIEAMICAIIMHPYKIHLLETACGALASLSQQKDYADKIVLASGIGCVIEAMRNNPTSSILIECGSLLLRNLAVFSGDYAEEASSGVSTIIKGMKDHPNDVYLQKEACGALWSLATHNETCKERILYHDGIDAMNQTVKQNKDVTEIQQEAQGAIAQLLNT